MEVLDDGIQVESLELLCIVELLAQGIGLGGALVQDVQLQLIGPPACVRWGTSHRVLARVARERAFTFAFHVVVVSDWVRYSSTGPSQVNASTQMNPIDRISGIYRAHLSWSSGQA